MNGVRVTRFRRPRVYTIWTACLLVLLAARGDDVRAQGTRATTADPAMVKGPTAAPVTIVEFSDYQ